MKVRILLDHKEQDRNHTIFFVRGQTHWQSLEAMYARHSDSDASGHRFVVRVLVLSLATQTRYHAPHELMYMDSYESSICCSENGSPALYLLWIVFITALNWMSLRAAHSYFVSHSSRSWNGRPHQVLSLVISMTFLTKSLNLKPKFLPRWGSGLSAIQTHIEWSQAIFEELGLSLSPSASLPMGNCKMSNLKAICKQFALPVNKSGGVKQPISIKADYISAIASHIQVLLSQNPSRVLYSN